MVLEAGPLEAAEIDQAFPVAALMLPGLGLPEWRALARAGEVLRVRNGHGYIVALCLGRVAQGKMHVDHAIALDLVDSSAAADALAEAVEARARARACAAIHARLADPALQARFGAAGHDAKVVLTCKPLDCAMVRRCRPESCLDGAGEAPVAAAGASAGGRP
jgi:hypothetical protein